MKKETKRLLLVTFIALTMFFSSVAWMIVGIAPLNPKREGGVSEVPSSFVVEGFLSNATAADFISRGFSLMEWHYYSGCCPDLQIFVEGLPAELDYQLVVQKLADSNITWATVRSLRGEETWNVTNMTTLLGPLCKVLLKPPLECGLMHLGNTSA